MSEDVTENIKLRFAVAEDVALILVFIKELAAYEGLLDQVMATEEILTNSLFIEKKAEVVIAEYNNEPVGFALFFHNFSTFLGRPGIYLEDLYVRPEWRGRGIGKALLDYLLQLAQARNCGRLEWWCLDSNNPAIEFYKKNGAVPMSDWTVYRITEEKFNQ